MTFEFLFALLSAAVGVAVAAILSPKDSYFVSNLLYYWVPQACVFGALGLYKPPRPAVFAGVALALAMYLAAFGAWVFSRESPESMAWLGYWFSFPGAIIGALVSKDLLARRREIRARVVCAVAAGGVLLGVAVNQLLLCSTLMYCWGK